MPTIPSIWHNIKSLINKASFSKNRPSLLCFGYSYTASHLLSTTKFNKSLATYQTNKTSPFKNQNKTEFKKLENLNKEELDTYDIFLNSIPTSSNPDPIIKNCFDYFSNRKTPFTFIYLSATSVYGDHQGNWVTEESTLKPLSAQGKARAKTEAKLNTLKSNPNANIIILRLSAIYGPHRNNIERIKSGKLTENLVKEGHCFSRIHVADISNVIKTILEKQITNETFNLSDNEPLESYKLNDHICQKILNIPKLPRKEITEEQENRFYKENKKVSNKKLKKLLNYNFIYPNAYLGLDYLQP